MSKPFRVKSKPCVICRKWFTPSPRLRGRQRACSPECSCRLEKQRQAEWRRRNPGYAIQRRADAAVAQLEQAGASGGGDRVVRRVLGPAPAFYSRVPWDVAKTVMGVQGLVLLAQFGRLQDRHAKTVMHAHIMEIKDGSAGLPRRIAKTPIGPAEPLAEACG